MHLEKNLCGKEFMDETRQKTSRDTLEYCGWEKGTQQESEELAI